MNDKEVKRILRERASSEPEKFYPVSTLKEWGFQRYKCKKCSRYFWSVEKREICEDPSCVGFYTFLKQGSPLKKIDYLDVWKKFSQLFKKFGYKPIKRYPVIARWRDDLYFTIASIAPFQPYVVSGEVDPPSPKLTIPQFCLRFNDIDNVGVTGRHYTGFVMIGQHVFTKDYHPDEYLNQILIWLNKELKIPLNEIVFHEDAWAGGGTSGPSLEFFSRSLELGNMVFMQFNHKGNQIEPLKLKVLDMGMGQERYSWFSQPDKISYETVFPTVLDYLYKKLGIKNKIPKEFLIRAAVLDVDEGDIEKEWKKIEEEVGIKKEEIEIYRAIWSIGDHTRTLLFALQDGGLPSNVGGGYNLRVILRRIFDFMDKFNWDIDLIKLFKLHAQYLKPQYPELIEDIDHFRELIEIERERYENTRKKAFNILRKTIYELDEEKIIKLYESHGITPGMIEEVAKELDIKVKIPSDISSKLQKQKPMKKEEKVEEFEGETEMLYYRDEYMKEFEAKVIEVKGNKIVLDKTAFYPEGGGQIYDTGYLIKENKKIPVTKVYKVGKAIVHEINGKLKIGDKVKGVIDWDRRYQIMKHHTSAHIINYACRKVLGKHVWQAGAKKTEEKAHLDITHYKNLSFEEVKEIERIANEIVMKNLKVEKTWMERNKAEEKWGIRIYQGGAVPGKILRIVKVGEEVEACGGTHLNNTGEIGIIKIINWERIADGVVRIEFKAGKKALEHIWELDSNLRDLSNLLRVERKDLYKTVKRFFEEWKELNKEVKKLREKILDSDKEIIEVDWDDLGMFIKKCKENQVIIGKNVGFGRGKGEEVIRKFFKKVEKLKNGVKGIGRKILQI